MALAIFFTGDLLRECALNSRTSAFDQGRRRLRRLLAITHSPVMELPAARDATGWRIAYRLSFLPARSGVRRGPAILSGASKAERKAAPKHITNVSYPGLCSIEQHI
jgi:hypothetical protein